MLPNSPPVGFVLLVEFVFPNEKVGGVALFELPAFLDLISKVDVHNIVDKSVNAPNSDIAIQD